MARQKASENPAIKAMFDKHGMANGVDGLDGTLSWWRKEDERPIVGLVVRAVDEFLQVESDIRTMAARIRRDLDVMERYMEEGYNLNQSGVLQRSGPELDMLAYRRQALAEHINALLWSIKKEHEMKSEAKNG